MPLRLKATAALLIEFTFDAVLLAVFIAQAFLFGCLLIYGHIPLPNQLVSQLVNRGLPDGLSLQAETFSLTLDGTVEIENLTLYSERVGQEIFRADGAVAELSNESGTGLKPTLSELVLSNGAIDLPAVYSPSGKQSTILKRIAFRLIPDNEQIIVDSFAALHEDIRLRGSLSLSKPETGGTGQKKSREGFVDQFFKTAAQVIREKSRIEGLKQPTLFFQIQSNADQSIDIRSVVSSQGLKLPEVDAVNLALDASLKLSSGALVSNSSVLFEADSIELPKYKTRAESIHAIIDRDEWEALLQGEWPDMEIAARKLQVEKIELDSPRIKIRPQSFPEIHFDGTTSGLDGAVEFRGKLNAQTRAGNLRAAGSVDLLSVASENVSSKLPPIEIGEPPYYDLSLNFSDSFSLESADLRARIDDLTVQGIKFDHIRAKGVFRNGNYSIENLYLRRDWQWLDLGFSLDSSTYDYELSLVGFAKPYDYNDLLPRWWGPIFKEFSFEEVEDGLGDFIIYGNAKKRAADLFFGHVRAEKVSYKDVMIDKGDLFVRGRGPYAEIHRLDAYSGDGFARGEIRFASRLDHIRGPMSLRLDLDTKLPLTDAEKLFDDNIARIIADFETDALPRTQIEGAIFNSKYPEFAGKTYLDLTSTCPFPVAYKGIPLDHLGFDLYGRSDITYLRDLHIGYANGDGIAQADVLTPKDAPAEARFTFNLPLANQDKAISQLAILQGEEAVGKTNSERPKSKGTIDLTLHARGPVEDPFQFEGYGTFAIKNEELSSIQLFGPLSRQLQNTRLGFTSFALTEMEGQFSLGQGTLDFEKLEVNGPRTRIEAPGKMKLQDQSLNMRVSVFLFGNTGNPDSGLRKIGEIITKPIPNLLEFELTGTPTKQKLRSLYDPRKLIPQF